MAIEFHCEHCSQIIQAPGDSGGRKGKCPHCGGVCYIPMPPEEVDEIPLAPLDERAERMREAALREDAAIHLRLMKEQAVPEEGRGAGRPAAARGGANFSPSPRTSPPRPDVRMEDVERMVVGYINAMSDGHLEQADALAAQMAHHRDKVQSLIDTFASDELAVSRLPSLPRPVLLGFIKQLRSRL